jgi:hypothetical protein
MEDRVTLGMTKDLRARSEELSQAEIDNFVAETKKWIGRELPLDDGDKYLKEQPVEPSEIRRFALCNRDPNPLWIDRDYARKTIWKDIIAPPLFMQHSYESEVQGTVPVQVPGVLQSQHWLHSGIGLELYTPIKPGDLIIPTVYFDNIEITTGKFIGQMFRNSTKTIVRNQRGAILGIHRHYDMLYSVAKAQEKNPYANIDRKQAIPPLEKPDRHRWDVKRQGATPRYYEDVNVGEELPAFRFDFMIMDIVAQTGAFRLANEFPQDRAGVGCHWHYNPDTCFAVRGMPIPFDFGQLRYTWGSRLLTDWAGDNAWVWKIIWQARKPIFAGDVLMIKGKVEKKYVENGRHCVDVYVWYENQRDEVAVKGTSTVILPSKQNPKAPILPAQPQI